MFVPKFAAHASPFKLSHLASRTQQHWQHIRQTLNTANTSASSAGVGSGSGTAGAGGAKWHAGNRAGGWGYQNHGRLVTQAGSTSQDSSTRGNDDDDKDEQWTSSALVRRSRRDPTTPQRWRKRSMSSSGVRWVDGDERRAEVMSLRMQARYLSAFHGARGVEAEVAEAEPGPSRPKARRVSTSATQSAPRPTSRPRRASVGDAPNSHRPLSTEHVPPSGADTLPFPAYTRSAPASPSPRRRPSLTKSNAVEEEWRTRARIAIADADVSTVQSTLRDVLASPSPEPVAVDWLLWALIRTSARSADLDLVLDAHGRLERRGSASASSRSYLLYSLAQRSIDLVLSAGDRALAEADAAMALRLAQLTGTPETAWETGRSTRSWDSPATELPDPPLLDGKHPLLFAQEVIAGPPVSQLGALEAVLVALAAQPRDSAIPGLVLPELAIQIFARLEAASSPSTLAYSALIEVLAKAGDLEGAKEVFKNFQRQTPEVDRKLLRDPKNEERLLGMLPRRPTSPLQAFVSGCLAAGDQVAPLEMLERSVSDVDASVAHAVISGLVDLGDDEGAARWMAKLKRNEVPFEYRPFWPTWLRLLERLALRPSDPAVAENMLFALDAVSPLDAERTIRIPALRTAIHRILLEVLDRQPGPEADAMAARLLELSSTMVRKLTKSTSGTFLGLAVERLELSVLNAVRALVNGGRFSSVAGAMRKLAASGEEAKVADAIWLYRALGKSRASVSLGQRLQCLGSPAVLEALQFEDFRELVELYGQEKEVSGLGQVEWTVLVTAGAVVAMMGERGQVGWKGFAALVDDVAASGASLDGSLDSALLATTLRKSGVVNAEELLARLGVEGTAASDNERAERLFAEGEADLGGQAWLRQEAASPAPSEQTVLATQPAPSETERSDPASAIFSPFPGTQTASPASPVMSTISLDGTVDTVPDAVSVPHPPFRGVDQFLSNEAMRLLVVRRADSQTEKLFQAVQQSVQEGNYLFPDAAAAMIEILGRTGKLAEAREMYVYGHVALSALHLAPEAATAAWVQVEDKMIIALALNGALEEIGYYKQRLIDAGEAPSADAYAAMIQHANETTDDANVALAYFEEATRLKVQLNTFLCNTIISKLSKARRAPAALEIYRLMKVRDIPRNAVTYGATINACCRTGDGQSAESLFQEMVNSPGYRARVPPFNTMIQFYVNVQPNRERVLFYFDAMLKQGVLPTEHTYNMLMQAYAFIEPADLSSMRDVFNRACADPNVTVGGSHWATLINAVGCVERDLDGAMVAFDSIASHPSNRPANSRSRPPFHRPGRSTTAEPKTRLPDAVCYEALFNVFLALHRPDLITPYVDRMAKEGVHMTAYVVNTLIRGHALAGQMDAARAVFESLSDPPPGHAARFNRPTPRSGEMPSEAVRPGDPVYREPSCYETMIRAEMGVGELERAEDLVRRMQARAYPTALIHRARRIIRPLDGQAPDFADQYPFSTIRRAAVAAAA